MYHMKFSSFIIIILYLYFAHLEPFILKGIGKNKCKILLFICVLCSKIYLKYNCFL